MCCFHNSFPERSKAVHMFLAEQHSKESLLTDSTLDSVSMEDRIELVLGSTNLTLSSVLTTNKLVDKLIDINLIILKFI